MFQDDQILDYNCTRLIKNKSFSVKMYIHIDKCPSVATFYNFSNTSGHINSKTYENAKLKLMKKSLASLRL